MHVVPGAPSFLLRLVRFCIYSARTHRYDLRVRLAGDDPAQRSLDGEALEFPRLVRRGVPRACLSGPHLGEERNQGRYRQDEVGIVLAPPRSEVVFAWPDIVECKNRIVGQRPLGVAREL